MSSAPSAPSSGRDFGFSLPPTVCGLLAEILPDAAQSLFAAAEGKISYRGILVHESRGPTVADRERLRERALRWYRALRTAAECEGLSRRHRANLHNRSARLAEWLRLSAVEQIAGLDQKA